MLNGLPCVILRPTIVYGPGSHFVRQIVQEAQSGAITLIDEGSGVCNGLYVDDLCEAIEAALHAPAAVGETLFINGDQPVTWGEFVLGFARAVRPDVHVTHLSSKAVLAEIRLRPEPQPLSTASRLVMRSKRLLAKLLRIQGTTKPRPISAGRVARETVAVAFSNAKAKHALAWQPQFDFASGLTATSRWLAATRPYATGK